MKKLSIKRWMMAASTIMILASSTGCSVQRSKCQGNHFDFNTMNFAKEDPDYYITDDYFRRALREKFFGSHRLITEQMFLKDYPNATPLDYEVIFDKVQKEKNKANKSIEENVLDEILFNWSIIDFLDYMIASEGKYQGKYFTDDDSDKIAGLFLSNINTNQGMYGLSCKNDKEIYEFDVNIDHPGKELYNISEYVRESVENEYFHIQKVENISVMPIHYCELGYRVNQKYQLKFYHDKENMMLKLTNSWEIANKKGQKDPIPCHNYQGTLSLDCNGKTIEAYVPEEMYEEIAEVIATAVQNKNTKDEFLHQNCDILEEVLGDSYKELTLNKTKVLQKSLKR